MSHRIVRCLLEPVHQPLLRLLRRACRYLDASPTDQADALHANGETVHHTGLHVPQVATPFTVPGVGLGSLGMLKVVTRETTRRVAV